MIVPRMQVPVAAHGGRLAFDSPRGDICDFSVCLNAFGPADVVRDAIRNARVDEYPDPTSRLAREAAAAAWKRPTKEIALGAGAAELIDAVCRAYLSPGDRVDIERPAFAEYERAARLCGAELATDRGPVPRLVFVCAPSSPQGIAPKRDDLRALADRCAERGSLLVLDQAYDAFADAPLTTPAFPSHPAVLHLRSLTKEHALAGVRVAYAVGPAAVIDAINSVRVPWSASSITQAAALATFAPAAQAHATRTLVTLRAEARRLRAACAQGGYDVAPSATHFFLIRVASANAAQRLLLEHAGLLVRGCSSFGMPEHIRVAARTPSENDRLIDALDRLSGQLQP